MAGLLQQLSGNPLSTAIGQKIEQATDPSLSSEDWTSNMEICDMVNDTDEGPRDAIRAIKKRFQQNAGKNHTVVMFTLTVLETCVKNCGRRFHLLITSKDFVQDLVKLIGPKNDPPAALQEKVLSLIQTWAEAFRSQPDLNGVYQVYTELKSKGIEFPTTDTDNMVPIHTPQRIATAQPPRTLSAPEVAPALPNNRAHPPRASNVQPSGPVKLNAEQLAKLRSELDVVQENMRIFGEMLDELTPGKEHNDDWELLRDLNSTCESMQKRIVEMIEKVANEDVTIELLRINDELNILFIRYERFVKKKGNTSAFKTPNLQMKPDVINTSVAEPSLIDLGDIGAAGGAVASGGSTNPSDLVSPINAMALTNTRPASGPGNDDFDTFAQSRSGPGEGGRSRGNSFEAAASPRPVPSPQNRSEPIVAEPRSEFDEMERWLSDQPTAAAAADSESASLANADFERFLAGRALAAEALPDQPRPDKKADPFGL